MDPNNSLDDQPVAESRRMKDGLKTCHKIVETYRAMLEQGRDTAAGEAEQLDQPNPSIPASSE